MARLALEINVGLNNKFKSFYYSNLIAIPSVLDSLPITESLYTEVVFSISSDTA